jgi:hypothetical protein
MKNAAKLSLKVLLTTMVLIKHPYCTDKVVTQIQKQYTIQEVQILPIPKEFSSLEIHYPGSRDLGEVIWVSDHENPTNLPLPLNYFINGYEVALEDLASETLRKRLDNHDLSFTINRSGNEKAKTLTKKNVFDNLINCENQSGVLLMIIKFSIDESIDINFISK